MAEEPKLKIGDFVRIIKTDDQHHLLGKEAIIKEEINECFKIKYENYPSAWFHSTQISKIDQITNPMTEGPVYKNHLKIQEPKICEKCGSESYNMPLYVESCGPNQKRFFYCCDPCGQKLGLNDFETEANNNDLRQKMLPN